MASADTGDAPPTEPADPGEIIARLQRFYGGGDPWRWLKLPTPLVQAYLTMIPRLQAEEALAQVTIVAVGSGSLGKSENRRIVRAWRRQSEAQSTRNQITDLKQAGLMLQSLGITKG